MLPVAYIANGKTNTKKRGGGRRNILAHFALIFFFFFSVLIPLLNCQIGSLQRSVENLMGSCGAVSAAAARPGRELQLSPGDCGPVNAFGLLGAWGGSSEP